MKKRKKKEYRIWYVLATCTLVIIGLLIIIFGQEIPDKYPAWKASASAIAQAVLISGVLGLMNELLIKEKMTEYFVRISQLNTDVNSMGIKRMFLNIKDLDYERFFKNASKEIDIVHIYGRTWTSYNIETIADVLKNSKCNIRIVLLSPKSKYIEALADTYDRTKEELLKEMRDVLCEWKRVIDNDNRSKTQKRRHGISIYYHEGNPCYSLYRKDKDIIKVASKLSKGKTQELPCCICSKTNSDYSLYNTYLKQINDLVKSAILIDMSNINKYFEPDSESTIKNIN